MKIFAETAPVEAGKLMEKRKEWGASPAIRLMGQGDKAARACTSKAVVVPLQRIFGFGRHPSPPRCSGNRRGRKRVCASSLTFRPVCTQLCIGEGLSGVHFHKPVFFYVQWSVHNKADPFF